MKTTVTFRHTESSEAIRSYVEERIDKISKYFHRPVEAHVVLSVEKFRHQAEVSLIADGMTLAGKEITDDMYQSIDKALDKIEKQAKKSRDRHKPQHHKDKTNDETPPVKGAEPDEETGEVDMPQVISSDRFITKPLSIEDAVMELNDSEEEFIVFRNAKTEAVNVLYRRKDGNFGLIEPE